MVTVASGSCPLIAASAVMLLEADPLCVLSDGIREDGGCFAQLGIKLSLFGTLLCGAPA